MGDYKSLSHVRWECKYHIVWIPKYRRKTLYGKIRRRFVQITKELCVQKGIEIIEGHAMPDHVHLCLSFPPKYSISYVVGFLKGKSAIRLHREFFRGRGPRNFWARGYFVSTVGLNLRFVREYIRRQEEADRRQMELNFDK